MKSLPEFNVLDHLSALEIVKETATEYHCKCPACDKGGFKINKREGKYSGFACDCTIKQIREAIKPISEAFDAVAPKKAIRPAGAKSYFYSDWDGNRLAKVERVDRGDGNKDFYQNHWTGTEYKPGLSAQQKLKIAPYRFQEVEQAIAGGAPFVFWVEGESAADALWRLGCPATTSIGGSKAYHHSQRIGHLLGDSRLVVCPDMDEPGIEYAEKVAADHGESFWLYAFPGAPQWRKIESGTGVDVADWITQGATKDELLAAIETSQRRAVEPDLSEKVVQLRKAVVDYSEEVDPYLQVLKSQLISDEFRVRGRSLQRLVDIESSEQDIGLVGMADITADLFSEIERRANGETLPGVPTGFYDLDTMTQGFQPSDFVVLAGRPAMGKTAMMLSLAVSAAVGSGLAAVFSLEMSKQQLVYRLLSSMSRIETGRLRTGRIAAHEWEPLGHAISNLSRLNVVIDDSAALTVDGIDQRLSVLNEPPKIVLIDYVSLIDGPGENNVARVTAISRGLKKLAKKYSIPVLALSQLSRGVEARTNKRPMMSDLRESGALEQDADLVMMLYREEYYEPDTPDRGIAELIVAKHRSGPVGTVKLLFEPQYTQFKNLARG